MDGEPAAKRQAVTRDADSTIERLGISPPGAQNLNTAQLEDETSAARAGQADSTVQQQAKVLTEGEKDVGSCTSKPSQASTAVLNTFHLEGAVVDPASAQDQALAAGASEASTAVRAFSRDEASHVQLMGLLAEYRKRVLSLASKGQVGANLHGSDPLNMHLILSFVRLARSRAFGSLSQK